MSVRSREDSLQLAKRARGNVAVGARRHCDCDVVLLIWKDAAKKICREGCFVEVVIVDLLLQGKVQVKNVVM